MMRRWRLRDFVALLSIVVVQVVCFHVVRVETKERINMQQPKRGLSTAPRHTPDRINEAVSYTRTCTQASKEAKTNPA